MRKPLGVVRKPSGVAKEEAIRRNGEKSCFTQRRWRRLMEAQKVQLIKRMRDF